MKDGNDYLDIIKTKIPHAEKMTKRPFGFSVPCSDGTVKIAMLANGNYLAMRATHLPNKV